MMWAYLGFFVIVSATALEPGIGPCRNMTVKKDIDPDKFLGTWYEYKYFQNNFDLGGKCTSINITKNEDGTVRMMYDRILYTGVHSTFVGETRLKEPPSENSIVKLQYIFEPIFHGLYTYWIVDTDYDSFAVVWRCLEISITNLQTVWLFTRDRHPKQSVLDKAFEVFYKNGIDLNSTKLTNQDDCPNF